MIGLRELFVGGEVAKPKSITTNGLRIGFAGEIMLGWLGLDCGLLPFGVGVVGIECY